MRSNGITVLLLAAMLLTPTGEAAIAEDLDPSPPRAGAARRYTPNSRIRGEAALSPQAVFGAVQRRVPVVERWEVWQYLSTLARLCDVLGFDFVVLAAQWDLETGTGNSTWWRERKNPAGIGVTGDPAQNKASQTWTGGEDAAYGHVAHMVAYVWGNDWRRVWPEGWPDPVTADQRFNAPIEAGYHAERLSHLNGTWALDPENNYDGKLASRANRILDQAANRGRSFLAKP